MMTQNGAWNEPKTSCPGDGHAGYVEGHLFDPRVLVAKLERETFFFLRKINPELTSAGNPPLFAEED